MRKLLPRIFLLLLITAAGILVANAVGYQAFRQLQKKTNDEIAYTFEITEIQYHGFIGKSMVTIRPEANESPVDMELIKQRALSVMEMHAGLGSSTNFVIGYIAPDTIDGQPVDRDAVIKELPKPRFWQAEYEHWSIGQQCNVMVQVTLDLSGKVSNVTRVNDRPVTCEKESDVIEAAQAIKFDPAVRKGIPVTQRQLFLYRLH